MVCILYLNLLNTIENSVHEVIELLNYPCNYTYDAIVFQSPKGAYYTTMTEIETLYQCVGTRQMNSKLYVGSALVVASKYIHESR